MHRWLWLESTFNKDLITEGHTIPSSFRHGGLFKTEQADKRPETLALQRTFNCRCPAGTTDSFTQQIFNECSLHTRHCNRSGDTVMNKETEVLPTEAYILKRRTKTLNK